MIEKESYMSILATMALSIGLGAGVPVTDDYVEYENPYNLNVEFNVGKGFNLWGVAEMGDFATEGQEDMDSWTYAAGVGYKYTFGDTFFLSAGAGYGMVDLDLGNPVNIPVDSYALFDVDNDWMGRVGGGFNLGERWTVNVFYNYFKPDSTMITYDSWSRDFIRVNESLDMSTYNVNLMFNF